MKYQGSELRLFAKATNWKKYFSSLIKPYLKGKVLEVGAGIMETTSFLSTDTTWTCLEPDKSQCEEIDRKISASKLPHNCQVINGTIDNLKKNYYDTILYIDVLEHIENDKMELINASEILNTKGTIIIISPAHNYLYTSFDKEIGHFRRYNKKMLVNICPQSLKIFDSKYLDSIGLFASFANRVLLNQNMPSKNQIRIWDKYMLPLSKITDPLLLHKAGKTIFTVLQK